MIKFRQQYELLCILLKVHVIFNMINLMRLKYEVYKMRLENTGIDNKVIDIITLDRVMGNHAFIRGEQWDYERVTYDYKIKSQEKNVTYYVRIQGVAIEGDVDKRDAIIQLKTPLLGKHYYPHGIEYGEDENFPKNLVERAHKLVVDANEELEKYVK